MTKGRPIKVILIPRGVWALSFCETCKHWQWLIVDGQPEKVCSRSDCNAFKRMWRKAVKGKSAPLKPKKVKTENILKTEEGSDRIQENENMESLKWEELK